MNAQTTTTASAPSQAPIGRAPRVSVVIPTHNRAELVLRAVRSVLAQTMADLELFIVDDASTDCTAQALAAIDDGRVRIVRLAKNRGQARAMNEGIARSRGEWVAFLDDDDDWLSNKLEAQLARAELVPAASAIYCGCHVMTSGGLRAPRERRDFPDGDITDTLLRQMLPITPSGYLVRREALVAVDGFDEKLPASQDLDLWLRMSRAGHRFAAVDEPLFIYHAEHETPRVSANVVAQLRAFRLLDGRWGGLMRERLGVEEYGRWRSNRSRKLKKANEKLARQIVRSGSRGDAWRYTRSIAPILPDGSASLARALSVAAFGRMPYRLSRIRQGKSGALWLRRLLGSR